MVFFKPLEQMDILNSQNLRDFFKCGIIHKQSIGTQGEKEYLHNNRFFKQF